jgi:nucleoside-diphosphate-sugar epimerase
MKVLIIGGNRFVGLRVSHALAQDAGIDLHILNRTGQAAHAPGAAIYKADRRNLHIAHLDHDWDAVIDFAAFDERDARAALDHFQTVGKYIFISSLSVYDSGGDRREEDFDASAFDLTRTVHARDAVQAYQDGKRRAEAVFAQSGRFPVLSVRFPLLLGPDDYTRRLEFHVQRIEHGRPLHIGPPRSRVSMLHAEDACRFLLWSLRQSGLSGPLNVASPAPIALGDLVRRIEVLIGRRALLLDKPSAETASPYAPGCDYFENVSRAEKLGFRARPINDWIDELIEGARSTPSSPPRLH